MKISSCSPAPILAAPHSPLSVVSFYRFADFPNHANLRKSLKDLCEELWVSGGIILAPEGINGSICGTRDSVQRVLAFIERDSRLNDSPLAAGEDSPFRWDHVGVKLKKEIVTLGMPTVSPNEGVGKYVKPREWNSLISDPDTVVIDVRNNYDIRIGKFKGAVDPCTSAFCDFPSSVDDNFELTEADNGNQLSDHELDTGSSNGGKKPPRVAMYCTGGIRCEKASSFLLRKGFQEVELAVKYEDMELFCNDNHPQFGLVKKEVSKSRNKDLVQLFESAVGVHHAGMLRSDRGLTERLFSDGLLKVYHLEGGILKYPKEVLESEEEKDRARRRQFEAWGVIGGPDKCRRPTSKEDVDPKSEIAGRSAKACLA
ncbi:Rhodanese-like domain-containing protein 7 [Linum grandiflorum]